MTVRQIAADYPKSRDVFRRYGEADREHARFGHLEPLREFARRNSVPLARLQRELAEATGAPVAQEPYGERVHRGFITAALAITLSAGAGWGAWLLWVIGFQSDFDAVRGAYVVAHGEAQLWGFVVFFVLGISLRTVLHPAVSTARGRAAAGGILGLGLAGVAAGFAWSLFRERLGAFGWMGGVALTLMALVWLGILVVQLHRQWRMTWVRGVLAAGVWLTVWSVATVWFRVRAGAAGPDGFTMDQRLLVIEMAVFGFTMNSIYAFGQKLLPGLLRLGTPSKKAVEAAHWLHNAGALGLCAAASLPWSGVAAAGGSVLMLGGAALFVGGHRVMIGRRRATHRPEGGHPALDAYPPLAFGWLVVSLILLSAGYIYESATGNVPVRAYSGAVRHALTVGFVTTLIVGVGQRLLPVLERKVPRLPRLAAPIFVLIGLGNLLRVVSEIAIIPYPRAFVVMPFSAFLEWGALLLFTCTAWGAMYWRESPLRSKRVTDRNSLAVLLAECPWMEDRLIERGSRYLAEVRSVPPDLSVGTFARQHLREGGTLAEELTRWLREHSAEGDGAR